MKLSKRKVALILSAPLLVLTAFLAALRWPCRIPFFGSHDLILYSGEAYYRCPWCGKVEFRKSDRIALESAPWVSYGDVPDFEDQPNGTVKIKHGFTKEKWGDSTTIIEVQRER